MSIYLYWINIGLIEWKESRRSWNAPGGIPAFTFISPDSDEDDTADNPSFKRIALHSRSFRFSSSFKRAAKLLVWLICRAKRPRTRCSCFLDSSKLVCSVETILEADDKRRSIDRGVEYLVEGGDADAVVVDESQFSWWADMFSSPMVTLPRVHPNTIYNT